MTSIPFLTLWRRRCCKLLMKASTISMYRLFSTYCALPISRQIFAEPVIYDISTVRMSHISTLYSIRYNIWQKLMSAGCVEVTYDPHSEMHQKMSEIQTLNNCSGNTLNRTGGIKLKNWCPDVIRLYSKTVYLFNIGMCCCTTINHFTGLHQSNVLGLIEQYNIPMPIKGSCLNLITSESNIRKVISKTPSKAKLLLFLHYTIAWCHQIRIYDFSRACPLDTTSRPFLTGPGILINGYYILTLKNMWW